MTLTKSALDGQFILCQNPKLIPQDWAVREKGSWILATHPSLPVVDILNDRSMAMG